MKKQELKVIVNFSSYLYSRETSITGVLWKTGGHIFCPDGDVDLFQPIKTCFPPLSIIHSLPIHPTSPCHGLLPLSQSPSHLGELYFPLPYLVIYAFPMGFSCVTLWRSPPTTISPYHPTTNHPRIMTSPIPYSTANSIHS